MVRREDLHFELQFQFGSLFALRWFWAKFKIFASTKLHIPRGFKTISAIKISSHWDEMKKNERITILQTDSQAFAYKRTFLSSHSLSLIPLLALKAAIFELNFAHNVFDNVGAGFPQLNGSSSVRYYRRINWTYFRFSSEERRYLWWMWNDKILYRVTEQLCFIRNLQSVCGNFQKR